MNSKTDTKNSSQMHNDNTTEESILQVKEHSQSILKEDIEKLLSENLITLQKVHAILMNCLNLTKKQKLEFAESERHFMKQYLRKLSEKLGK